MKLSTNSPFASFRFLCSRSLPVSCLFFVCSMPICCWNFSVLSPVVVSKPLDIQRIGPREHWKVCAPLGSGNCLSIVTTDERTVSQLIILTLVSEPWLDDEISNCTRLFNNTIALMLHMLYEVKPPPPSPASQQHAHRALPPSPPLAQSRP